MDTHYHSCHVPHASLQAMDLSDSNREYQHVARLGHMCADDLYSWMTNPEVPQVQAVWAAYEALRTSIRGGVGRESADELRNNFSRSVRELLRNVGGAHPLTLELEAWLYRLTASGCVAVRTAGQDVGDQGSTLTTSNASVSMLPCRFDQEACSLTCGILNAVCPACTVFLHTSESSSATAGGRGRAGDHGSAAGDLRCHPWCASWVHC